MKKRVYTDVNVGKTLKFEHRMKVNDLVNVLKHGRISSEHMVFFPGMRGWFYLKKKEASNDILVYVYGFGVGENCRYAGKVEVDIDGVSQTKTFGNLEKNELLKFHSLGWYLVTFPYTDDGSKKIKVEVKWTIYQRDISVTQQEEEILESLMSQAQVQGSLSEAGKAIVKDELFGYSRRLVLI